MNQPEQPIEALLDEIDARMAKVARRGNPLHSRYLDPLEFWCDLAEALGHPRPDQADIPALVSEVAELRQRIEREQEIRDELDIANDALENQVKLIAALRQQLEQQQQSEGK